MDNIEYSEKEIAIFNGLVALIKEGANPYSIKVSDIANAAKIGKGTIYDYFKSKEEAISKAIIYNINREIIKAFKKIDAKETFKEKFYEILNIIANNLDNNLCTLKLLLSSGGVQEFYKYLVDDRDFILKSLAFIDRGIDDFLELGFNEGVINFQNNQDYQRMAIYGAISGFSHYINRQELNQDLDIKSAMDTAYELLIKALN